MISNSPLSSQMPWHLGHQSTMTEDLPKRTATIFTVLHLTQERLVGRALVFSMSAISSLSQRNEPSSTLFFRRRSSSLMSQIPLHLAQPSNWME